MPVPPARKPHLLRPLLPALAALLASTAHAAEARWQRTADPAGVRVDDPDGRAVRPDEVERLLASAAPARPREISAYPPAAPPAFACDVVAAAGGVEHGVALASDGAVWSFGLGYGGRLGDGIDGHSPIPVVASLLDDVVAIGPGDFHTVAVRADGSAWAWGEHGANTPSGWSSTPEPVAGWLTGGGRGERMQLYALELAQLTDDIVERDGWFDRMAVAAGWFSRSPYLLMEEITDRTGIDPSAFEDSWQRAGPPYDPVTGGGHLLDIEHDGNVDLLVTDVRGIRLYRGHGDGTFEDITLASGMPVGRRVVGALVADLNNDGFQDLVLSVRVGDLGGRSDVYENLGDGTFWRLEEWRHNLGSPLPYYGSAAADYDGDGRLDLYLSKAGAAAPKTAHESRWLGDQTSAEGVLLRNLGAWRFEDVTADAGMTTVWCRSARSPGSPTAAGRTVPALSIWMATARSICTRRLVS